MNFFSDAQIGLVVKSARCAAGFSARELAELSGLLPTALSRIENGKRSLGFAEAISICQVLGIRVDHLVSLAGEIELIANESANVRDLFRQDLKMLQQRTIMGAIKAKGSETAQKS